MSAIQLRCDTAVAAIEVSDDSGYFTVDDILSLCPHMADSDGGTRGIGRTVSFLNQDLGLFERRSGGHPILWRARKRDIDGIFREFPPKCFDPEACIGLEEARKVYDD